MDVSAIGGKVKKSPPRTGNCRKHAPIATTRDKRVVTQWPRTTEKKWCGDFEITHGVENGAKERCGICSYWKEITMSFGQKKERTS